uniref:RN223 n=1 Tax=Poeciliopsis prolifica TaxID=188132 RepID=A0A0S7EUF1_9TELE
MADDVHGQSGSAFAQSNEQEEYECKICYNHYDLDRRVPKELSCSHTFCLECLETLHSREGRGWRVGCPVCRHRTPVREYQVENLRTTGRCARLFRLESISVRAPQTRKSNRQVRPGLQPQRNAVRPARTSPLPRAACAPSSPSSPWCCFYFWASFSCTISTT